eukprot:TRINITY_DN17110_c0_g1_i1.p1 TRINITY_DN17110_c0_g1~~TRINITY_DN17110_c0_g1_i1.p1  ORF type:complete len:419 (-),score=63.72 TRINITY_DN17110_c0_g1_i1:231-1487(-)
MEKYAVLGFFRVLRIWIFVNFLKILPSMTTFNKNYVGFISKKFDFRVFLVVFEIACVIISLYFSFAGLVNLFESDGDPWLDPSTRPTNRNSFFVWIYFATVSAATVGYGDVPIKTYLGKITTILFILLTFVILPYEISKLIEIITSIPKTYGNPIFFFDSKYQSLYFKKTILITGSVTPDSLKNVLNTLYFEGPQGMRAPRICILNSKEMSGEMEEILRNPLVFPHIYYFQGSPISRQTLILLQIENFDNAIILADKNIEDPILEDSKNIIKYWSIKNYSPRIKIYIQIMTENMKKTILEMPIPEYVSPDSIVCFEELRNSFFSQNCLHPGISTLLTNMIKPMDERKIKKRNRINKRWEEEYSRGAAFNIFFTKFSKKWVGLKFKHCVKSIYLHDPLIFLLGIVRSPLCKQKESKTYG